MMKIHMKLQGKLIAPSLLTLILLMTAAAFVLAHLVIKQLEEDTRGMLNAANLMMGKNIANAADSYKQTISSLTEVREFKALAGLLAANSADDETRKDAVAAVQKLMRNLPSSHPDFVQYNLTNAEGLVIASSSPSSVGKVRVDERAYFHKALSGTVNISEPVMSKSLNTKALMVAAPLKDNQGRIAGVLYGIMTAKDFTTKTVGGITIGKTGYSYLVDAKSGLMTGHENEKKIAELNMFKTQPWMREISPGSSMVKVMISSEGIKRLIACFHEPKSGIIAVSCMEESELEEQVAYIRNVTLAIMLGSALIVAVVMVLIIRAMTRDVQATNAFAQAVAGGKLDSSLPVQRKDELGELGDALRNMVKSLKEMIAKSDAESQKARQEAERAQVATEQAREAANNAEESSRRMLSIAERLEQMGTAISSASTELAEQIAQSDKGAADSAARLEEAASAMNEMNSTVQEVARNAAAAAAASDATRMKAANGAEIVGQAVTSIGATHEATVALQSDMAELNKHAQSISQIMSVISDIADQTNLLALNAAIEAARAGEAGRGFAVVADEVRKLAEKTMASTADVGNVTTAIQTSAAKSMEAMEAAASKLEEATGFARQSGEALQEIVSNVEATTDQVNAIATAAEEQSAASEEINRSIAEVNALSGQNAQAMNEASSAVNLLSEQMNELNLLMGEMRG